jgi:hypothetical protein
VSKVDSKDKLRGTSYNKWSNGLALSSKYKNRCVFMEYKIGVLTTFSYQINEKHKNSAKISPIFYESTGPEHSKYVRHDGGAWPNSALLRSNWI